MALSETVRRWLIWSVVLVTIVALRVGCVLFERSRPFSLKLPGQKSIEKDYLVVIPKFYVNDLKDAEKLIGHPLWVKAGYQAEYFPFPVEGKNGKTLPKQKFEPLNKIMVQKIVERPLRSEGQYKEILLLFQKGGQPWATVIGFFDPKEKEYQMRLDDLFYSKDPAEIYSHWSPETWQKVRNHELDKEMTFAQVALSLGNGTLVTTEAGGVQLYQFARAPGGKRGRTRVRFAEGRVREFQVFD
jgi:hypothetical protein